MSDPETPHVAPKIDIHITANTTDAAGKVLKIVGTAIETNGSLDIASVKVEPRVGTFQADDLQPKQR